MKNRQKWISFGNRKNSLLAANFKMIAWSNGLEEEIGVGLKNFIINSSGDQFVVEEQIEEIDGKIKESKFGIDHIDKTYKVEKRIMELLKEHRENFKELFDLWIKSVIYFYIANEVSYSIYSKTKDKSIRNKIEEWRNDGSLYNADSLSIKKISQFSKLTTQFIGHCTFDEIKEIINGKKIDQQEIKQRFNKPFSLILSNGKIKLVLEDLNPLKNKKVAVVNLLKGHTTFKFDKKITGIVGKDILVVSMTKPDMVSKIKKMKAVITDEGGVLCHAAITAREFKIPTIIGTKIATKVLKDGDRVEVDANNGVVKMLN